MDKDTIKKGVELAEKELQEQQISEVKNIVKDYLEEIEEVKKEKEKLDKKLSTLKKDLDDIKSGRLDKIEERHKLDPEAKKISIIYVQPIQIFPTTPWRSIYEIHYANHHYQPTLTTTTANGNYYVTAGTSGSGIVTLASTSSLNTSAHNAFNLSGTTFQNFAGGTYNVGGRIINL